MTASYQDLCQHVKVTDLLQALLHRLPALSTEVSRQKEYADLAGDDHDPCRERQREISQLIGQLKRMHAELESLRRHRHEWGSDDYCCICGADGRA